MAISSTQSEVFLDPLLGVQADLSSLPSEMIQTIFEKLPYIALKNMALVSKRMHAEVKSLLLHKSITLTPLEKDAAVTQAIDAKFKMLFSILYKPGMFLSFDNCQRAFWKAAGDGDQVLVQSLSTIHGQDSPFSVSLAIFNAVGNNHLDVVRWLVENMGFRDMRFGNGKGYSAEAQRMDCIDTARQKGHLEIVEYLDPTPQSADPTFCSVM